MKTAAVWVVLVLLASVAHAQSGPVRLNVTKVQKKDRKTTYQSTSGQYRQQQIRETVFYTVEVTNFGSSPLRGVKVKWAVLIDPSHAEARGSGFSVSSEQLKLLEGERICDLGVGQKFVFDTDVVDLSAVTTGHHYDGRRYRYGGEVRGYVVEVVAGGRLLAAEVQPPDARRQIEQLKSQTQAEQKTR